MSAAAADFGPCVRPMLASDLSLVMASERAAYEFPWTEEIIADCLRVGYHCCVAEKNGAVVGHGIMSVGAGECHVLNICVHPQWQGQGIGRHMLRGLLSHARARNADTAFLEVRASNALAYQLYVSEGFCEVGTRRGYYPAREGREDAVVLARSL